MSKTIDISKINLSPKGIGMLVLGIGVLIVVYKLATWGVEKISGTTESVTQSFRTV